MTQLGLLPDLPVRAPRKRVERTSVKAAREMSLVLERRQRYALVAVTDHPGLTSGELTLKYHRANRVSDGQVLAIRIGLSMLKERGYVEHVPNGERKCARSGRTCVTWRVRQR